MPKIFLLGGENVFRRSAREVNMRAFEQAGHPPNVLVFPWARASFDKKYRKRKVISDYFFGLGARSVDFVEYTHSEGIAQALAKSDIAYLTGGLPSVLIERLKTTGIDNLLKEYKGIIIGRSAGALALCKKCITTCRTNSKVKIVDGLGLVDITLKAHYTPEKDETLKRLSMKETIFAVPQDSALVYDNGELSAIGSVFLFNGGERKPFNETTL